MRVWRGTNNYANDGSHKPSDPGDFGAGTYHSTQFYRARCHGAPAQRIVTLKNPFIASVESAYTQIADVFDTIHADDRVQASRNATRALQAAGFDGIVSINDYKRRPFCGGELEIVVFAS
jgi:hypothetical protein